MLDVVTDCGPYAGGGGDGSTSSGSEDDKSQPLFSIESAYKHLSAHPTQWKLVYNVTNVPPVRAMTDVGLKLTTERSVRARIQSLAPDVVISVHPMMTAIPSVSCAKIGAATGRHLPMFTVVTDLGSGHDAWFAGKRNVEKVFLASDALSDLAVRRGRVPRDKIVRSGLPIRHEFGVQAGLLGRNGRTSPAGREYRRSVRERLDLVGHEGPGGDCSSSQQHRVVMVMGGGEGVGSLSSIVDSLYVELTSRAVDATIVVVCGRNAALKASLETRDWGTLLHAGRVRAERRRKTRFLARKFRSMLSSVSSSHDDDLTVEERDEKEKMPEAVEEKRRSISSGSVGSLSSLSSSDGEEKIPAPRNPTVRVHPLGFVTKMAEYMVASDVLVTKAGPGTIAEAASVGLPVLLTSYLPGQEEGNVDFVLDNEFGSYVPDSDPDGVARECAAWFRDEELLDGRSRRAMEAGVPHAAEDIARFIGKSVVRWKELNEEHNACSKDSSKGAAVENVVVSNGSNVVVRTDLAENSTEEAGDIKLHTSTLGSPISVAVI